MPSDMNWAKEYLLDPLNAPEPADETGPGSHFGNTFASNPKHTSTHPDNSSTPTLSAANKNARSSTHSPVPIGSRNPFRDSVSLSDGRPRAVSDATRPHKSRSPSSRGESHVSASNHSIRRKDGMSSLVDNLPRRIRSSSVGGQSHSRKVSGARHARNVSGMSNSSNVSGRSRAESLGQGPLEAARDEHKLAYRAPHLRKKHIPGRDVIDKLDFAGYHHDSPYDAASMARNLRRDISPLAAVHDTNIEALKATPRENIIDSVQRHRPLDGTAAIAPGEMDRFGRRYEYQEGDNMMIYNGANYKRWPGVDYLPEDIKGKGEPSFSIDRALKEHKLAKKQQVQDMGATQAATSGIEMQGGPIQDRGSKFLSLNGVKRRIGSIKRKPVHAPTATV